MRFRGPAFAMLRSVVDEFLACYRELRRHLVRELRNADDAADIAQSSFEKAYAHALHSPCPIESPRALLFRTAHHLVIDAARHRQVVQAWATERSALDSRAAVPSAESVIEHRQLVARVVAQLEQLPARRREVFLLFRAYGYSRAEIAVRLGITEAAVAKHVVRAVVDCSAVFAALRGAPAGRADAAPCAGSGTDAAADDLAAA